MPAFDEERSIRFRSGGSGWFETGFMPDEKVCSAFWMHFRSRPCQSMPQTQPPVVDGLMPESHHFRLATMLRTCTPASGMQFSTALIRSKHFLLGKETLDHQKVNVRIPSTSPCFHGAKAACGAVRGADQRVRFQGPARQRPLHARGATVLCARIVRWLRCRGRIRAAPTSV